VTAADLKDEVDQILADAASTTNQDK